MNKTLTVFTAVTLVMLIPLAMGHTLASLPVVMVGSLAASVCGLTVAVASGLRRQAAVEVEIPRSPVIVAGSVWGVGV